MKAVVLEKPGKFSLVDIGTPGDPGPGEALGRIRRVGICGTRSPRDSGKLVFVGVFSGDVTFHEPTFHAREMTVLGCRNATAKDHLSNYSARGGRDDRRHTLDNASSLSHGST